MPAMRKDLDKLVLTVIGGVIAGLILNALITRYPRI